MVAGRIAVALMFAAAAVGKGRYLSQFVDYLRPVFRHQSKLVAVGVLVVEGSIAVLMPLAETSGVAGIAAVSFLVSGTSLIAVRLSLDEQTACGCWGRQKLPIMTGVGYADMLRPAWYGLRNGVLCLAIWIVSQGHANVALALIFLCVCIGVILVGLGTSVVHELDKLKRPEHPRRKEFAPHLAPLVALAWYSSGQVDGGSSWTVRIEPPRSEP